jgi:hypothetical protein
MRITKKAVHEYLQKERELKTLTKELKEIKESFLSQLEPDETKEVNKSYLISHVTTSKVIPKYKTIAEECIGIDRLSKIIAQVEPTICHSLKIEPL